MRQDGEHGMGKTKRKLNKKKQQKRTEHVQETMKMLRDNFKQLVNNDEYTEALEVLAEMIQQGGKASADDMYNGAYCYFMSGDYERAAKWLDNVLSTDPANVKARLLLARLCILEGRTDSGLAIYDFVIEHDLSLLDEDQREEMQEILQYYVRNDAEHIKTDFPFIASFMNLTVAGGVKQQQIEEPVQMSATTGDNANDIDAVLHKEVSLKEKIHLLNMLAGGKFLANEYQAAAQFLEAALQLDAYNDETLRNLAVLAHAMKKDDVALQYVARMSVTDFVLLANLKA